jgi:hypothetical protein
MNTKKSCVLKGNSLSVCSYFTVYFVGFGIHVKNKLLIYFILYLFMIFFNIYFVLRTALWKNLTFYFSFI